MKIKNETPVHKSHRGKGFAEYSHAYWIGFLGAILLRVAQARSLRDAKRMAKEGLGSLTDPSFGVKELGSDTRQYWREVAREDEDE